MNKCEMCGNPTNNPRNNFIGCMTLCKVCYEYETAAMEAIEHDHLKGENTE